jgi:hypothetical protein
MKMSNNGSKQKVITDFKVVRGLGRGAFGQVYMVRDIIESSYRSKQINFTQ